MDPRARSVRGSSLGVVVVVNGSVAVAMEGLREDGGLGVCKSMVVGDEGLRAAVDVAVGTSTLPQQWSSSRPVYLAVWRLHDPQCAALRTFRSSSLAS